MTSQNFKMPEDLRYQGVYYVRGPQPKEWSSRYAIQDPPSSGNSYAFVIGPPDADVLTLFCPFTLQSYKIRRDSGEIAKFKPENVAEGRRSWLVDRIRANWLQRFRAEMPSDYGTAALVLSKLGAEPPSDVPEQAVEAAPPGYKPPKPRGDRPERKGGKPPAERLLKPIARGSKRGQVAEYFMRPGPQSVSGCMEKLGMSRNSVLSALHGLNKDHGLGYSVSKDVAEVEAPECDDVWAK